MFQGYSHQISQTIFGLFLPRARRGLVLLEMGRIACFVALCSTMIGVSRAAGQGSAAEYADGTVHARIMGLKMVRPRCYRE